MIPPESLSGVRVLSFDLYGTLVDMQGGLVEAIAPFLLQKGYAGHPNSVVTWWRRTHFQDSMIDALIKRGHTPYREIGRRALSYTLTRAGIPYTGEEVRTLVSAIERLKPFADVSPGLTKLKARYRLAILSNGDTDMLQNASFHHGLACDDIISIDLADSFKPDHVTYKKAAQMLGAEISQVCHVAAHPFDCIGAKASGMRTIYVNRRNRPYGFSPHQPDLQVRDFTELVDRLAPPEG